MTTMQVRLRSIPDTGATLGWAGAHSVVVDRPEGQDGGAGLGFTGGELLALAIGGCFCNDLHHVAAERGIVLGRIAVDVSLRLGGKPLLLVAATLHVEAQSPTPGADMAALIAEVQATSTVSNSIARGIPIRIAGEGGA